MKGALLIAGTTSDAGKSVIVAGLCRWLARQGVKVAPFKAQNMALNSGVTVDGAEIGRAQMAQAAAAGIAPEAAMNPVLLKPSGERSAQVIVLGRPSGYEDAQSYQQRKASLRIVVLDALADLRSRFDVVVCEGAGSPAEINLREHDLANMGLARAAVLPTLIVGDIDRGGIFAAFCGTLALLEEADRALVAGWIVNKFRGDTAVLAPGLEMLRELTARPTFGVVPWVDGLTLDVEDSLSVQTGGLARSAPPLGRDGLTVTVLALPRLSNITDVDALATEPGVVVRITDSPVEVERADLAIVPGTKATVDDLRWVRARGLDRALAGRAAVGAPVLGVCGGYQLLGERIIDPVESAAGEVAGLGLLPVTTVFTEDKVLARPRSLSRFPAELEVSGYEIHHGHTERHGGAALLDGDGCAAGAVLGTSWHGLLENDLYRRALLRWVAERRHRDFVAGEVCFADARERRLDLLGDLVERHLDTTAIAGLLGMGGAAGAGGGRALR